MDRDSLELRTTVSADGTLRLHLEGRRYVHDPRRRG